MTSQIRGQIWLIALGGAGITFLMFTAPFFRFGLGYLILLPALSIAMYCEKKFGNILPTLAHKFIFCYQSRKSRRFILAVTIFLTTLTIVTSVNHSTQYRLFLPPQLQKVELLQKRVNTITYFFQKMSYVGQQNYLVHSKFKKISNFALQPVELKQGLFVNNSLSGRG